VCGVCVVWRCNTGQAVAAAKAHLAVATQPNGIDLDGLDHGPPLADHGPVHTEHGLAVAHHGDVGGGAAHVGDHRVLQTAQSASPQYAGGGAAQHGAYGLRQSAGNVDQAAIAFDHHQGGTHAALRQRFLHGFDQGFGVRDHACIERCR
jgi:hypothetical protein